jgi:sulfite exporter TauE/SafE/copper chaperone CopZ
MRELSIPIKGMHCKACTIVVADELEKIPGVTKAKANLNTNSAVITYTHRPSEVALENAIKAAGYTIGTENKPFFSHDKTVYQQLLLSLPVVIIVLFVLQDVGVTGLNLNNLSGSSALLALAVGLTAGFSTCMAMVGGLVLGISARYAEKHPMAITSQKFRPHLFFNAGRIAAFFALGGLLGLFGSVISLNSSVIGLFTVLVGVVMIILGLQLIELFPKLSSKSFTLPTGIAKALGIKNKSQKEYSHNNAMLLGAVSFFLPCGFTQAMQLVAISSGSFYMGAIIMGLFAIGTTPGLLSIGAITSVVKGSFAKSFFRFVGLVVIFLAFYNISNGFNLMGYNFSLSNSTNSSNVSSTTQQSSDNEVTKTAEGDILATTFTVANDISPNTFTVKVGQPYVLKVDAKEDGQGCMSTIMIPGIFKDPLLITEGAVRLPFTIEKPGTYKITCAMGIPRGTITATR